MAEGLILDAKQWVSDLNIVTHPHVFAEARVALFCYLGSYSGVLGPAQINDAIIRVVDRLATYYGCSDDESRGRFTSLMDHYLGDEMERMWPVRRAHGTHVERHDREVSHDETFTPDKEI